jgi:zinc protease
MTRTITETPGGSFATITAKGAETVVAYLSIDIHAGQTAKSRAVELIYTDALISGAGKYDRAAFLSAVNGLGATISAGISDGVLTVFVRCRSAVASKVFTLVTTMLEEPTFEAKEISRIKETVINIIKDNSENTCAIAHEQLRNTFYGAEDRRHTHSDKALIEAIKAVTAKDLKTLHTRVLQSFFTCSIASDSTAIKTCVAAYTGIKKRARVGEPAFGIHQQLPPQPVLTVREVPSKQNIDFSIGVPVPMTLHHPDYIPLVFGLLVLGGPLFSSRLMSTVREKEGLTYGIYAQADTFLNEEQGYIKITTFFSPEKSIQGLTSTFHEVALLYKKGISEKELAQFKKIYKTRQELLNDSLSRQLNDLHAYHMQKFSLEEIAQHKAKIDTLTVTEVNTALRRYLNPATLTVSAAGPTKAVKKDLEAFMKSVA